MVDDRIFYLRAHGGRRERRGRRRFRRTRPQVRTFALTVWKTAKRPCWATSTATKSPRTARRCWSRSTKTTPSSICPRTRLRLKDEKSGKDYKLKLAGLDMQLDRHAEWNQIYFECWRQMRDFFYSPNMNGVDWKAHARQIRRAASVRKSSQRSHLSHRRADRRIEQRPRLCRRRRTSGDAAHQARPARRRVLARPGHARLSHRPDSARRKLGRTHPLAANRHRCERERGRLPPRHQRHRRFHVAESLRRAHRHRRQTGHPPRQLQAHRHRRARHHRRAHRRRAPFIIRPGCRTTSTT